MAKTKAAVVSDKVTRSVVLPVEVDNELKRLAAGMGMPVSTFIRMMLEISLKSTALTFEGFAEKIAAMKGGDDAL